MTSSVIEKLSQNIQIAPELYYRLILIVGPAGSGKTKTLQALRDHSGWPLVNVNLELSQRLLDLSEKQQALRLPRLLDDLAREQTGDGVLLDNTELLFHPRFQQDPLRLLQGLSRNRTIVAAWNGKIQDDYLIYAEPDHPEYRRYPVHVQDFQIISLL